MDASGVGRGVLCCRDPTNKGPPMGQFHEFEMQTITGDQVAFDTFQDKVSLVVNVASK